MFGSDNLPKLEGLDWLTRTAEFKMGIQQAAYSAYSRKCQLNHPLHLRDPFSSPYCSRADRDGRLGRAFRICGWHVGVLVATCYGLGGTGIESRWVTRFFVPFQTGPEAHPAS
jgi:hypothetical protein